MVWLAEKIKQRWHKIDVTDWLLNSFDARLTRKPNQQGNTRGFFEHCFLPEEMMRAQAVAMIARVHNDRSVSQVPSFKAGEDSANALIHQRNQTEITLFNTPIFLRGDAKKKLSGQSLPIEESFRLLPFPHQTITQWNIFTFRKRRSQIEFDLVEWMLIVEGSVVRRMRFYKTNNEDERIAAMFLDKFACMFLEKLWSRQLNRQVAYR